MIKIIPIFNSTISKFLDLREVFRDDHIKFIENVIFPDMFGRRDGDFFVISCTDNIENGVRSYTYYVEDKSSNKNLICFKVYTSQEEYRRILNIPVVSTKFVETAKSIPEQLKELNKVQEKPEKVLPVFIQTEKCSDNPIYPIQQFCRILMLSIDDLKDLELRHVITAKENIDNIVRYSERDFQKVLKYFNDSQNHQWYTSEDFAEKCGESVETVEDWKSDCKILPMFVDKNNREFYDSSQLQYVLRLKEEGLPYLPINRYSAREVIKYTGYSAYSVEKILTESGFKTASEETGDVLYSMDSDDLGILMSNILKYTSPEYYNQQELLEACKLSAPTFNKHLKNRVITPVWTSPMGKNYFKKDDLNTLTSLK